MRHDKEKVFELRRNGKTYREIKKEITISQSTLSQWLKGEEWSKNIQDVNTRKQISISTDRLRKMNEGRRIMLEKKYNETEKEAIREFEIYKNDPLFIGGLMLYAGEGDKRTKGVIRLANTDFFVHRVFLEFIKKFTKTPMEKIRFSVLLYPDLNIEDSKIKWSQELKIPLTNFHKPIVIQGRSKNKRLHFGVGSTIISNSFLKRKILLWMDRAFKNLSLDAVIV
ncbi:hypothetical protein HYZ82_02840 [Candidatus Nomurabacteria bacterium]|nr:hypothetical protein [Candidatus Nomurabacteria bacterium]